jgi:hypothetical protein
LAQSAVVAIIAAVEDKDANQEALEQVQRATESGPVDGEELLGSEELKRQYREAQKRLEHPQDRSSERQS